MTAIPTRRRELAGRALLHAREFGHAHTLAFTLWHAAMPALLSRDVLRVERLANESARRDHADRRGRTRSEPAAQTTISGKHGFPYFLAYCDVLLGWVAARRGQGADGIDRMRRGIAAATATGARLWESSFLGLVAEALALASEVDQGIAELDQALARSTLSGVKWADAELHRLRGALICRLARPDPDGAERSFRAALSIAREQGTRGFELRAATSLARLWRDQGKRHKDRDLLVPVYSWFTEGFDTLDLKEAKALLDELASQPSS